MSDIQENGPVRQTFSEFMKLLESYGMTDEQIAMVLSRDVKKMQQAIGAFDVAIEISSWWRR